MKALFTLDELGSLVFDALQSIAQSGLLAELRDQLLQ